MRKLLIIAACTFMAASAVSAEETELETMPVETELAAETEMETEAVPETEAVLAETEQEAAVEAEGVTETETETEEEKTDQGVHYECSDDGKSISVYAGDMYLAYMGLIGNYEYRLSDPCDGYAYVFPVDSPDDTNRVGSVKVLPEYSQKEAVGLYTGDEFMGEGSDIISEEEIVSDSGESYMMLIVDDNGEDTAYYAICGADSMNGTIVAETHSNYFMDGSSREAAIEVISCVMNGTYLSEELKNPS